MLLREFQVSSKSFDLKQRTELIVLQAIYTEDSPLSYNQPIVPDWLMAPTEYVKILDMLRKPTGNKS